MLSSSNPVATTIKKPQFNFPPSKKLKRKVLLKKLKKKMNLLRLNNLLMNLKGKQLQKELLRLPKRIK